MPQEALMGNYSVRAELTNSLVKSISPLKKVSCVPESVEAYLNKPPEITDITYPARIVKGQQVEFTIRATDPDENGALDYVAIDWDKTGDLEIFEFTGTYVKVKHTFAQSKQYSIFVNVADNGYVDPHDLSINYKKFDEQELAVTVRLI